MRLLEQFRVHGSDGQQHTVACFQDSYQRLDSTGHREQVDSVRLFRLNGRHDVQRVDDDTFLTDDGRVLRRQRQDGPLTHKGSPS